jgi:undecaprenyl-diphosphatase
MMPDIDQAVQAAFNAQEIPGYGLFFSAITQMGSAYLWIAALIIYLWIGRWKKVAAVLIIALVFGMVVNEDIKGIVQRIRPENVMIGGYFSFHSYSFPSGHTETAFIIATVLSAFIAWRYSLITYLLAAAVGLSRIYLGVHYFTDVVAGAVVGILLGLMAIYGLHRLGLFDRYGTSRIVPRPAGKLDGKGWRDANLIKYATVILAGGFIAAFAAVLLSQYILSLAAIGAMYIVLLMLPLLLKRPLYKEEENGTEDGR